MFIYCVSFCSLCSLNFYRDLKNDNVFIDDSDPECPQLVLSDFGYSSGLHVPYTSNDVPKGGNIALMAPEVVSCIFVHGMSCIVTQLRCFIMFLLPF